MAKLQTTRVRDVDGDPDFKYIINASDFDPKKHERVRKELGEVDGEEKESKSTGKEVKGKTKGK